jgi:hypothetical protein
MTDTQPTPSTTEHWEKIASRRIKFNGPEDAHIITVEEANILRSHMEQLEQELEERPTRSHVEELHRQDEASTALVLNQGRRIAKAEQERDEARELHTLAKAVVDGDTAKLTQMEAALKKNRQRSDTMYDQVRVIAAHAGRMRNPTIEREALAVLALFDRTDPDPVVRRALAAYDQESTSEAQL